MVLPYTTSSFHFLHPLWRKKCLQTFATRGSCIAVLNTEDTLLVGLQCGASASHKQHLINMDQMPAYTQYYSHISYQVTIKYLHYSKVHVCIIFNNTNC